MLWQSTKQASRFAPWAWQSPKISLTTPVIDVHQMLLRAHVVTWGWWKYLPSPPGSWLIVHSTDPLPVQQKGGISVKWRGDFSWLTVSDLEVICLALNYLLLTLPVLIIPLSFSHPCVTRRKNCKHVRLLFSANSLSNQCQTRLCLKTSLAPTTREGDRVTFLVNQQLDFHFGTLWVLLLLLRCPEG